MRFSVQKSVLAKALATVGRSIATRATLPALSGVLMDIHEGNLVLSGSNLETAVQVKIKVDVEEEGLFLTPSRLFTDFILSLPEGQVVISTDETVMTVTMGKIKSTFSGMPTEEYPELGFDGHQTPYTLPGEVLATAIDHVSYAASSDDARAILTGLHIHVANGVFELAATDGFRLAVEKMEVAQGESFQLVLPSKVMVELARLLREHIDSDVAESSRSESVLKCGKTQEGTQMLFVLPNGIQVISRLLEGTFPPYQKIIPTSYATRVWFDVDHLMAEVKRAALFSSNGSNMLRLEIQNGESKSQRLNGIVMFSSGGGQSGEYSGEIDVEMEGSENKIAFNAKYLLEFLTRMKAKRVCLEMNRADTAGLWRVEGLEEYVYVVMPMNL